MKIILKLAIPFLIISCSPDYKFNKDKPLFESSKVLQKFTSVRDLNDSYFEIKENNFFEYYRSLFDSVKNTRYPGRYTKKGDTLLLQFYNKKGLEILGGKALINERKKEILFLIIIPG